MIYIPVGACQGPISSCSVNFWGYEATGVVLQFSFFSVNIFFHDSS